MKKVFFILVCVLVFIAGCTPEKGEAGVPAGESGQETNTSKIVSDTPSDEFYGEADYQSVTFASFEEIAEISLLSTEEDYNAYFKDGQIPLSKSEMADLIDALSKMPIPMLDVDRYELAVISCDIYSDGRYYIELVYNGETDRLRTGTGMLNGALTEDTKVTDTVADTITLGEHTVQMYTMVEENDYCDLKGRVAIDGYVVYAHYKGGTVLPDSLKQGLTLTTLDELIKPYIK